MSSSSSLFASAHPLLPPPVPCHATLDVTTARSSTKLCLPGPDGGALASRDAGPRLAPLVPGTNLNVAPPAWALASDFRPYTLFPHSAAAPDDAPDARGASRPPDFIAAAENLKKLFAMPFSDAPVRARASPACHKSRGWLALACVLTHTLYSSRFRRCHSQCSAWGRRCSWTALRT